MFRTKNILIAIVVIAVILAGGYLLMSALREAPTEEMAVVTPSSLGRAQGSEEGILAVSAELPTYVITNTREIYAGSLGLRGGANRLCEEEFGVGSMMYGTQHINCYAQGTCLLMYFVGAEAGAWFDYTSNTITFVEQNASAHAGWNDKGRNCNGWTNGSSENNGSFVTGAGRVGQQSCDAQLAIACATPAR
jgi:hypothetical protein